MRNGNRTKKLARWTIIFPLYLASALIGCRSKLDVETKSGAPVSQPAIPEQLPKLDPPKTDAPPVAKKDGPVKEELFGNAQAVRSHYFVKDTIEIALTKELLEGASHLDIFNVTKVGDPSKEDGVALFKDYEVPDNLDVWPPGKGFIIENKGSIRLKLFQTNAEIRKNLFTGKNKLKVVARDGDNQRSTFIEVVIVNSKFFEFSNLSFGQGKSYVSSSTKGQVLEAWLNPVDKPVVKDSTGKFTLTVGPINQMFSY